MILIIIDLPLLELVESRLQHVRGSRRLHPVPVRGPEQVGRTPRRSTPTSPAPPTPRMSSLSLTPSPTWSSRTTWKTAVSSEDNDHRDPFCLGKELSSCAFRHSSSVLPHPPPAATPFGSRAADMCAHTCGSASRRRTHVRIMGLKACSL